MRNILEHAVTSLKTGARLFALMIAFACHAAGAQDIFTNRPAFSPAEVPSVSTARCDQLRAMAEGLGEPDFRVDLSIEGELTAIQTDGALWYLVVCNLPDLRVMCVAYQQNDMKPGDRVGFKGANRRLDANHAVLDPCLASTVDEPRR